jgi:two-component system sensor histidine kinase AlgZ
LHAGFDMQPIIRQNAITLELPDFRNLGTILRIVLAVNAMAALAALVKRRSSTSGWCSGSLTAVVEPRLTAQLVLYAREGARAAAVTTGALAVAAITVAIGLGVHAR